MILLGSFTDMNEECENIVYMGFRVLSGLGISIKGFGVCTLWVRRDCHINKQCGAKSSLSQVTHQVNLER